MSTATRYRSPTRYAEAAICLDEFSTNELVAELKHRSGDDAAADFAQGSTEDGFHLTPDTLSHLKTLVLCGQRESALRELSLELEPHIGKLLP